LIDSLLLIRNCSQLMECSDRSGARSRSIHIYFHLIPAEHATSRLATARGNPPLSTSRGGPSGQAYAPQRRMGGSRCGFWQRQPGLAGGHAGRTGAWLPPKGSSIAAYGYGRPQGLKVNVPVLLCYLSLLCRSTETNALLDFHIRKAALLCFQQKLPALKRHLPSDEPS
jgi:hypothetical protein